MTHIPIIIYGSNGEVLGTWYPPDDPDAGGGLAAETYATMDEHAVGAAIAAMVGKHLDKALNGITVEFKVKA